jgi:YebC/PmpR family DNA-binding regulatory protein
MSGHSKWANIKRQKQAADVKRGQVFSKLSRLITLAVIQGGGITDPEYNVKLRLAIEKAKQANMPKENIKRAIERGVGPEKDQLKELMYEAFGPENTALLILTTTDNPNRTRSQIRETLDKNGGKLVDSGAVNYLFTRCGLVIFSKNKVTEEKVFDFASKVNAFDIDEDKDNFYVYLPFENLGKIKDFLEGLIYETAEVDFKPNSVIQITDSEKAKQILNLVELLESLDDVQKVFGNFDISESLISNS